MNAKIVPAWMFAIPAVMIVITAGVVMADAQTKKTAGFTEEAEAPKGITEEKQEAVKTAFLEVTAHEQKTEEKESAGEEMEEEKEDRDSVSETASRNQGQAASEAEVEGIETETGSGVEKETPRAAEEDVTEAYYPVYIVDGDLLDPDLQRFLYEELKIEGIEWWMEYAMLTAYQESSFNTNDISNGLDCGLLQYRKTYWEDTCAKYGYEGADIFNPYVQIVVYVKQTAKRLKEYGCSIEETISRHMMSDYGEFNPEYVSDVMSHTIEKLR